MRLLHYKLQKGVLAETNDNIISKITNNVENEDTICDTNTIIPLKSAAKSSVYFLQTKCIFLLCYSYYSFIYSS